MAAQMADLMVSKKVTHSVETTAAELGARSAGKWVLHVAVMKALPTVDATVEPRADRLAQKKAASSVVTKADLKAVR